jgi:hypothetical protein
LKIFLAEIRRTKLLKTLSLAEAAECTEKQRNIISLYQVSGLKTPFTEIPPVLPFSKGGELFRPAPIKDCGSPFSEKAGGGAVAGFPKG